MRIGIDARMMGLTNAGIGRYVSELVKGVTSIDNAADYFIFVSPQNATPDTQKLLGNKVTLIPVTAKHYSLSEQVSFPLLLRKYRLDLMHFPHFTVPLLYRGNFLITIHDLIKHASKGSTTTTEQAWLYWLKYIAYRFTFWQAVSRASRIIVPSNFVKTDLAKNYPSTPTKTEVIYEGVDVNFQKTKRTSEVSLVLDKYHLTKPYFLYVGSVYPHKNPENLIKAMVLVAKAQPKIKLYLVCGRSIFWERLNQKISKLDAQNIVQLVGFVPDKDLPCFYQGALGLVFPTLMEGFGLPGLEAMGLGCPVLCSDIPVLREVYGSAALYFNPHDPTQIAKTILAFLNQAKENNYLAMLANKGKKQAAKYSWSTMCQNIIHIYYASCSGLRSR